MFASGASKYAFTTLSHTLCSLLLVASKDQGLGFVEIDAQAVLCCYDGMAVNFDGVPWSASAAES